jgi:type IV pilus assembly protein PilX
MMNNQLNNRTFLRMVSTNQSGTALVTSLVMLLIMTMIGIGSLKNTLMQEKMTGNVWDRSAAFQATEISLRDAENFIETLASPSVFSVLPTPTGLLSASETEIDYLETTAWNTSVAIQSSGEFDAVEQPPFHVIKHIKDTTGPGGNNSIMVRGYDDVTPGTSVSVFKITAKGSGRTDSARSILQTYYAKRF